MSKDWSKAGQLFSSPVEPPPNMELNPYIKEALANGAANYCSVSGGKDSTATAIYAISCGVNPKLVFCDTGHESQITYAYLDYLETALDRPIVRLRMDFTDRLHQLGLTRSKAMRKEGFTEAEIEKTLAALVPEGNPMADMIRLYGWLPAPDKRFCTTNLKTRPMDKFAAEMLETADEVISWQGIRADESRRRAKRRPVDDASEFGGIEGMTIYLPILDWTAGQVFAYIKQAGIEPNPLYKMGHDRVGCFPCIMAKTSALHLTAAQSTDAVDRVRGYEAAATAARRPHKTELKVRRPSCWFPPERVGGALGIDAAVKYAATKPKGNIISSDGKSCASPYGNLCE